MATEDLIEYCERVISDSHDQIKALRETIEAHENGYHSAKAAILRIERHIKLWEERLAKFNVEKS